MKNTKEMQALLTAIYCINLTGNKDKDITNLCEYAYHRCFNANHRMILLCTIGKSKEEILPEVMQLLEQETQYKKYLEENNN